MPGDHSSSVLRHRSLGDIIVDLSRLRGIAIEVPDNSIPREYVGLRDKLSPTDKGKGKARQPPPRTASTSIPQGDNVTPTTSATPLKRRREEGEADDVEEKAAYEARLRTYSPAAPRVSSFLGGPPLAPEPGVSRRLPPQDYRAPPMDTIDSTGSEDASVSIGADPQRIDGTSSTGIATSERHTNDPRSGASNRENPLPPSVGVRGPFDHMNLGGEPNPAEVPRPTPWFPTRIRPFDYLTGTDSSEDSGPIQQPTFQQSVHSSRGLTSFSSFSSNTPFSGPTFPSLDIPHDLHSSDSSREGSSFPTNTSSPFSPYLPTDWEIPPLNHRPQPEPRYPHVYVTFGAGVLQKEIDMHTADNPVEAKESAGGMVEFIPYHVPTYVYSSASTPHLPNICAYDFQGCASYRISHHDAWGVWLPQSVAWVEH